MHFNLFTYFQISEITRVDGQLQSDMLNKNVCIFTNSFSPPTLFPAFSLQNKIITTKTKTKRKEQKKKKRKGKEWAKNHTSGFKSAENKCDGKWLYKHDQGHLLNLVTINQAFLFIL